MEGVKIKLYRAEGAWIYRLGAWVDPQSLQHCPRAGGSWVLGTQHLQSFWVAMGARCTQKASWGGLSLPGFLC